MKKILKSLLIILCLFSFSSCKKSNEYQNKDNNDYEDIEYISYPVEELEKLDSYKYETTINNVLYNYTYYFKDDKCVGSKEKLTFSSSELAKKYYDELEKSNESVDLKIDNNVVTYYLKSEYFEYLLYPKETLIDLLNSNELE